MLKLTIFINEGTGITSFDIKTPLKKFNIAGKIVRTTNAPAAKPQCSDLCLIFADYKN